MIDFIYIKTIRTFLIIVLIIRKKFKNNKHSKYNLFKSLGFWGFGAMARNYYFNLHGFARSCNLSCLDQFYSYLLITKERKNHLV